MAQYDTNHELFLSVHDIFGQYNRPSKGSPKYSSIVIQPFVFHDGKVLLLQPKGASGWTTPSITRRSNSNEGRAIPGLIMQLFHDAIRTRTLDFIQFMDLALPDIEAVLVAGELHISALLSVHEACTPEYLAQLPGDNQDLQWAEAASVPQLRLENGLSRKRLNAAFDKYATISEVFKKFRRGQDPARLYSFAFNSCKLARRLQTVYYGGSGVDHILVAVKEKKDDVEGLFLLWKVDSFDYDKFLDGEWTKVVLPLGFDAGQYPEERMDLVGAFETDASFLRDQGVNFKVMVEEDQPRLKMSWRWMKDRKAYFA